MTVTLFHFQGSPNCAVARLAARRKGLAVREVELLIGVHAGIVRALGFPRSTVPAARIGGRRVQGTTEIMRAFDALVPEPPLFPTSEVEEAERWGAEYVQTVPRRILAKLIRRAPESAASFNDGGIAGRIPAGLARLASGPALAFQRRRLRTGGQAELLAALTELPGVLDRLSELLAQGTLSADEPTAADLQIAPQIRVLMCLEDIAPVIETRPDVAAWTRAVAPDHAGHVPPVLTAAEREVLAG